MEANNFLSLSILDQKLHVGFFDKQKNLGNRTEFFINLSNTYKKRFTAKNGNRNLKILIMHIMRTFKWK